ncbi:BrnA antitoxin family protein [Duganella sp. LjRoot269]|jgi:putative transcriptional regulator|uniref:BrnA antitoxin family protein n=1 Tax=Duganella sp. LjRoot269 TaxID=3342305 RepID=UPI00159D1058
MPSDKEEFQRDLLESVKQMRSGQAARLTQLKTQDAMESAVDVSLRLTVEVLERWKATGPGWQQRMSDLLSKTAP